MAIPTDGNNLYDNGTGNWMKKDSFKPAPPPSDIEEAVTVVLKNDAGWTQPYVYYWSLNGTASVTWPGIEMEKGDDGLYYYTIPDGNYFVIFNNGIMEDTDPAFRKTADMKIPTDSKILYNNAVLENSDANDDKNWEHFVIKENPEDNTDPEQPGTNDPQQPGNDNPEQPKEMSFLQKLALKLLLFLRSIEDMFKGFFKK